MRERERERERDGMGKGERDGWTYIQGARERVDYLVGADVVVDEYVVAMLHCLSAIG